MQSSLVLLMLGLASATIAENSGEGISRTKRKSNVFIEVDLDEDG